jgi:glucose-6-phosphate 1-dehydrogenase
VPHSIFDHGERGHIEPNRLVIELQPEEDIALSVMNKKPGLDQRMKLQPIQMSLSWGQGDKDAKPPRRRIAYERLLLDALSGDSTLFVRRDEAEQAWKWVDEVSDAWRGAAFKPKEYAAGSWGPAEADLLLERGGRAWNTGHG